MEDVNDIQTKKMRVVVTEFFILNELNTKTGAKTPKIIANERVKLRISILVVISKRDPEKNAKRTATVIIQAINIL